MLKPFTTLCALIRKSDLLQPSLLAGKTYPFLHLHHDQPASKLCPALWCHCTERSSFQQLPFFHPFLFLSSVPMIHFPASPEIKCWIRWEPNRRNRQDFQVPTPEARAFTGGAGRRSPSGFAAPPLPSRPWLHLFLSRCFGIYL